MGDTATQKNSGGTMKELKRDTDLYIYMENGGQYKQGKGTDEVMQGLSSRQGMQRDWRRTEKVQI